MTFMRGTLPVAIYFYNNKFKTLQDQKIIKGTISLGKFHESR